MAQRIQKIFAQGVGGIQTKSVDFKLINPEIYGSKKMFTNLRIIHIKFYQILAAGPALVVERVAVTAVAVKIQVFVPVFIW